MTKTRLALLCFLGALLTAPAANAALPLPRLKGETYERARAQMIKAGYQPVRFLRTEDGCLLDSSCKRYPELFNCLPTRSARCQFAFIDRPHHKYIVLTTLGQPRRVDSIKIASRRERTGWPLIEHSGSK